MAVQLAGPTTVDAEELLPGSCKIDPGQVIDPGCLDAILTPEMTLPNLAPDIREVLTYRPLIPDPEKGEFVEGPLQLGFDSWVQNIGHVPFQLTVDDVDPMSPDVSQCVVWAAPYVCREMRPVGGFTWHDPHQHFHYDDFERYELRRVLRNGRPDYRPRGLIAMADKVGFCLIDSRKVRDDGAERPFYSTCSQLAQGTSPGWADVYDPLVPGQQFPIEGVLTDGRYAIVITLNVNGHLYETDYSDNVVELTVELSNGLTQATIVNRRYP